MSSAVQEVSNVRQRKKKRKKRFGQHNLARYRFVGPWVLSFLIFGILPIVASFFLAFTDYNALSLDSIDWIGLANFRQMFFEDLRYWKSVKATFYYAFTAIPLRLAFALAIAMLLNSSRRLVGVYRALLYAPSIVGASVAVAVVWREMLRPKGPVNAILHALFGIPPVNFTGDPRIAIWVVIFFAVWQFGSSMLIFLAGLKQIPFELYESAAIDGAGGWAKFIRITLPLLTPIIFFNLVMQMINGFTIFTEAFILSSGFLGSPLDTTLFYAIYLYSRGFVDYQMGYSAGMAWVLLVVVALFTALVFKSSTYWVFYASEKGETQ
jgi:multiple sugar transport system permease protein